MTPMCGMVDDSAQRSRPMRHRRPAHAGLDAAFMTRSHEVSQLIVRRRAVSYRPVVLPPESG